MLIRCPLGDKCQVGTKYHSSDMSLPSACQVKYDLYQEDTSDLGYPSISMKDIGKNSEVPVSSICDIHDYQEYNPYILDVYSDGYYERKSLMYSSLNGTIVYYEDQWKTDKDSFTSLLDSLLYQTVPVPDILKDDRYQEVQDDLLVALSDDLTRLIVDKSRGRFIAATVEIDNDCVKVNTFATKDSNTTVNDMMLKVQQPHILEMIRHLNGSISQESMGKYASILKKDSRSAVRFMSIYSGIEKSEYWKRVKETGFYPKQKQLECYVLAVDSMVSLIGVTGIDEVSDLSSTITDITTGDVQLGTYEECYVSMVDVENDSVLGYGTVKIVWEPVNLM